MKATSSAFREGGGIPRKYTCDGDECNPPLEVTDIPKNARSLAIIMEDPDSHGSSFTHWILFNIPANHTIIDEIQQNTSSSVGIPGINDAGNACYFGPCPPIGVHRYIISVYALDSMLPLVAGARKEHLMQEMVGHVLAEARLMCTYIRAVILEDKQNMLK